MITLNAAEGYLYLAPMQLEADHEWTQIIGEADDNSVPKDEFVLPGAKSDTLTVYDDGNLIFSTNCDE